VISQVTSMVPGIRWLLYTAVRKPGVGADSAALDASVKSSNARKPRPAISSRHTSCTTMSRTATARTGSPTIHRATRPLGGAAGAISGFRAAGSLVTVTAQ
jgi:hypothetical protein